jgi:hypothetical protein
MRRRKKFREKPSPFAARRLRPTASEQTSPRNLLQRNKSMLCKSFTNLHENDYVGAAAGLDSFSGRHSWRL